MDLFASIGARLKEERKRAGMSQSDLAKIAEIEGASGATRQSQSLYEKGERMPDAAYLAAADKAGIDVQYVITGRRGFSPAPTLKPDEAALLDNYRNSPPEARDAIKATSVLLAQSKSVKKKAG